MSYVDSFDHELVGILADLAVYHPLVTVNGDPDNEYEFGCTPNNLIIGGGVGEHQALILLRPDLAVGHFILDWIVYDEADAERQNHEAINTGAWWEFLDSVIATSWSSLFQFPAWGIEDYCALYEKGTSQALHRPYDIKKEKVFEIWLAASLGELIFFAMPDLFPDLDQKLPGARELVNRALYLNILLPPRGYPTSHGRITENSKVIYGKIRQ